MKTKALIISLALLPFFSLTTLAQDSIKVSYSNQKDVPRTAPSYYLNGVLIAGSVPIMNSSHIISIDIKNETQFGEVYITAPELNITFLTPEQIKEKYVKNATKSALYTIDGKIVSDVNLKVEEDYILAINVIAADDVNLNIDKQKLTIINILTKSKENIAASKAIMIKGIAK